MPDEVSVIPELRPAIALASLICSSHADSSSALHWVCAHSAWRRLRPDRMGTGPHPGLSCRLIVCNSMTFRLSAVGFFPFPRLAQVVTRPLGVPPSCSTSSITSSSSSRCSPTCLSASVCSGRCHLGHHQLSLERHHIKGKVIRQASPQIVKPEYKNWQMNRVSRGENPWTRACWPISWVQGYRTRLSTSWDPPA